MSLEALLDYIQTNLEHRLKRPYVSIDYNDYDKQKLYKGIEIALLNAEKVLTTTHIIEVFDAMKPEIRANMKYPIRRGSVAFLTKGAPCSKQGLLELLEWAEKNKSGYGPRFELIDAYHAQNHYKTVKEMRDSFRLASNQEMADKLFSDLQSQRQYLNYIPPFDCLNPLIDRVNLTPEEEETQERIAPMLAQYQVFNEVEPKFENLVAEFNRIEHPSLVEIAGFIKSMVLLHPFPDGNGRTFTLGILNQLLLKNKLGICLNIDPRIATLSNTEIAKAIENNLILLEQFELDAQPVPEALVQTNSEPRPQSQIELELINEIPSPDMSIGIEINVIQPVPEVLVQTNSEPRPQSQVELDFIEKISLLKQKMSEFKDKPQFKKAYDAAFLLHRSLEVEGASYFAGGQSRDTYRTFKDNCEGHIKTARVELDKHRGVAKIIVNILAIVFSAGIGYGFAAAIDVAMHKGKFTFFSTDSALKINAIEETIAKIAP